MKIKKIDNNKKYVRKVEGMGNGLVLFEVSATDKKIGQNYHLFYEDKRKPPLDIAINPEDGTLEYISYFIQDEMIGKNEIIRNITKEDTRIGIYCDIFDENNSNIAFDGKFDCFKVNNDIWILKNDVENKLCVYEIDDSNAILFAEDEFCGLIFYSLNIDEIQQLTNSKCL